MLTTMRTTTQYLQLSRFIECSDEDFDAFIPKDNLNVYTKSALYSIVIANRELRQTFCTYEDPWSMTTLSIKNPSHAWRRLKPLYYYESQQLKTMCSGYEADNGVFLLPRGSWFIENNDEGIKEHS